LAFRARSAIQAVKASRLTSRRLPSRHRRFDPDHCRPRFPRLSGEHPIGVRTTFVRTV